MKINFKRAILTGLLCMGIVIAGCATFSPKPEEAVTERANARWQALLKGDMDKAYNYSTPGFRAVVDPIGFRSKVGIAGRWWGAQVVRVECDLPTRCKAVVRLEFSTLFSGKGKDRIETHIDETWLFEDGQWWFFQKV